MPAKNELRESMVIRQIIGRDCHVSTSYRDVIRHVISKLRNGKATFSSMPPEDRKEMMRQCIHAHRVNWEVYSDVMRGNLG